MLTNFRCSDLRRFATSSITLLFSLITASCTNDAEDPGDPYYQPPVVNGIYQLTVLQTQTHCNFSKGNEDTLNLITEMDCLNVTLKIHEDGTLETNYTDLLITKDTQTGEYTFNCGKERNSTGTWTLIGDALKLDTATIIVYGDQLVDARKPEVEPFNLLIFSRIQ